jgi:hypothetical protein
VLEGVGHFVPREAPSQAAEAILRLATWPGERPDH